MDRLHLPFASRMVYQPPPWLLSSGINPSIIPKERLNLGRFPTPLQQFNIMSITSTNKVTTEYDHHNESIFDLSSTSSSSSSTVDPNINDINLNINRELDDIDYDNNNDNKNKVKTDDDGFDDLNLEWWIKRDDLSSFDLSGNKVRKLEFLLYIAKYSEAMYDSVITIGGLQSNHAKATAIASRQLGLDPYLILRKPLSQGHNNGDVEPDIGLTGNLLFNRMIGADIRLVSPSSYAIIGSNQLCQQLAYELKNEYQRNPYIIPVGGSNVIGAFGYIDCIQELIDSGMHFDHIVFGCGSGGTAAGIALGVKLSHLSTQVHAIGVCDTPDIFYEHIEMIAEELGLDVGGKDSSLGPVRDWLHIYSGQGLGYAKSTQEELSFIIQVAHSSGIILDPVYSGKALYYFINYVMRKHNNKKLFNKNDKILFIHTGGTIGLYDKESEIVSLLTSSSASSSSSSTPSSSSTSKVSRMKITKP